MSAPMINFPLSVIVDGLLSYVQWIFGNPEITPSEYRWNIDDRKSLIRICGPFVIDNEKPMSAPFVVIERGSFAFANQTINNLKSGDSNTFENSHYSDWMDGTINVIVGSGAAGEASSIANFLAIMFQSERQTIKGAIKCLRRMDYLDVSAEIPVVKDTQIRRWEVTLRLSVSLQQGWINKLRGTTLFSKASIKAIKDFVYSNKGSTTLGADTLVDATKDFGFLTTNDPQFVETEFTKGWYYVKLKDNVHDSILKVLEIVDNHTLKLGFHDENDVPAAWSAPETASDVEYDILWNNMHLSVELPTNT